MRPKSSSRVSRPARIFAGALAIAAPTSAVAFAEGLSVMPKEIHTPSATAFGLRETGLEGIPRLAPRPTVRAGSPTTHRQTGPVVSSVASWYEDAGTTACGFHAHYGVASPTLPCGTQVRFTYHGTSVIATVDDRGPFVGGRSWDLNQNTAAALQFGGVDTVESSA